MATVHGDDNGVLETCDEAEANCDDCDWETDGDGMTVLADAQTHVDETGHTVSVGGHYYGSVSP